MKKSIDSLRMACDRIEHFVGNCRIMLNELCKLESWQRMRAKARTDVIISEWQRPWLLRWREFLGQKRRYRRVKND